MSASPHRRACLVYDAGLTAYDFGPQHPLGPVRVELTIRLARELGVLDRECLSVAPAPVATDERIATVHDPGYIAHVRRAGSDAAVPSEVHRRYGLDSPDNPAFAGMHEASARVVGASVEAARRVREGEALHAVNIAGGLHHAMPAAASGFCVYNDPAVAIRWLLEAGCERICYVDTDAHHGDGVQAVFYDDPRVLTISLHESTRTLFPYTGGLPGDTGGPKAEGSAVNVALPAGTSDAGWLRAFHAVVPPLVRAFAPTILVSQHGCDGHARDPLTHLNLTVDGQRAAYLTLHELAHEVCGGRWMATGGGGYALSAVVPRAWAHLLAIMSGSPLDPATDTPEEWRAYVRERLSETPPERLTDGGAATYDRWEQGYDPGDDLDRAVHATRLATFPFHGLDPLA